MIALKPRTRFSDEGGSRPLYAAAVSVVLALLVAMVGVLPASASNAASRRDASTDPNQVDICHSGNGKHFTSEHPAKTADAGGHAYEPGSPPTGHFYDIIPPFHYVGPPAGDFPGQNWDALGQEIFNNNCDDVVPDLVMLKSGPSTATVNDTGSYSLSVRNDGDSVLRQLTVTDTLPAGVTVTATPTGLNWTCSTQASAPQVTCTQDTGHYGLAHGATSSTITVPVSFGAVGTATDSATVQPLSGETHTANNTKTFSTAVAAAPAPDLRLGKTVSAASAVDGDAGTYTLTVYNTGTGTETQQITVTDTVPADLTIGTIDTTSGFTCGTVGQVITCTTDTDLAPVSLAASAMTLTVHVTFGGTGLKTNTASVSSSDDSNTTNNSASADTTVTAAPVPDLRLAKSVSTAGANAGDAGTYTLTVYNTGTGTETQAITVTDTVPADLTIGTIDTTSGFTCSTVGQLITCTTDTDLAPVTQAASTMTLTVHVTFGGSGVKTNTAGVSSSDDSDTTNNSASAETTVTPLPSGAVIKSNDANEDEVFHVDETAPAGGHDVQFKLHVTNTSPYTVDVSSARDYVGNDEEGIAVDCLPALRLDAGESGDCYFTAPGYSGADGVTKTNTATVVLTRVTEQVDSLRRVHAAAVALPPSTMIRSNASTVVTHVPVVIPTPPAPVQDLSIVKTGPTTAKPGDSVSYTMTVTNLGAANSGFTVTDQLPSGLAATTISGPGFTCTLASVSCTYPGTLAAGGTAVVTVVATVDKAFTGNSLVNTAVVSPTDGTPGNNSSSYTLPIAQPGPGEDLALSKTGPGSASPGDELVYDLKVTNVKGTAATNFVVTDTLPKGLSYSSATGQDFTCTNSGQTISCTYTGTLPVGSAATIQVRALLDSSYRQAIVTNTAVVDPATPDTDATDNSGSATTQITKPISGGGGGGAEQPGVTPSPSPKPSHSPAPAAGGTGGPGALPFTGSYTDRLLTGGVGLLLLGLVLALGARRRSAHQR